MSRPFGLLQHSMINVPETISKQPDLSRVTEDLSIILLVYKAIESQMEGFFIVRIFILIVAFSKTPR